MENKSINKRIESLRKTYLGLTLEKFGAPLGVQSSAVSKMEKGRTNITEQMIKSICNTNWNGKYVNEKWLRTGKGDAFFRLPAEDEYFKAATSLSDDPLVVSALVGYYKLNSDERDIVMRYVSSIVHDMDKQAPISDTSNDDPFSDVPYDPEEFDKKYFPNESNGKNGNTG